MDRSYTTPLKTSSVPFKPNGVWRAVVTAVDGTSVFVRVPRLSGELEYGPLDMVLPNDAALPAVDDPVLVAFVEGRQDELVVLGVVKTTWDGNGVRTVVTTSGTSAGQQLDGVLASAYRSAKFLVQASSSTGHRVSELLALHDGSSVSFTEYAVVSTGTDPVTAYDVNLSGGQFVLSVTPAAATVVFVVVRTAVPA